MVSGMTNPPSTRRRWLRFRLRTLLIVIALVAVPLAWIAKERRQSAHEQQLAAEFLEKKYHRVELGGPYDSWRLRLEGKPQGKWRDLARQVLGERIYKAEPIGSGFNDLTPFAQLTNLQWLSVNSANVYDLKPLADLSTLEVLNVRSSKVVDLTPVAGLRNVTWLRMQNTRISDLTPLASWHKLQKLQLTQTPVDDLTSLAGLVQLDWLDVSNTQVSDLSPLAGLANLTHLYLESTPVSDLTPLAGLRKLVELKVKQSAVSRQQVETLQIALPNCDISHDPFP
jgi:Leucine Rich repeats (2 copies)